METKLKETLRQLHATLAHHGPVDEELQALLRQLDGDWPKCSRKALLKAAWSA